MPRLSPVPDSRLPTGPFLVSAASARGVPRHHLRTASFERPFAGVRAPVGAGRGLLDECRALALTLDDGVLFSHVTALRLLGVEVPWRLADDDALHVVTPREEDRPQRDGVIAHRTRQATLEACEVEGLPVTSPAQTWVHLAVGLPPDDAVVLGDAMMRRKRSLVTSSALAERAARTIKVKGIVAAREQVARMRPGTDSSMETRTRLLLVEAGLPCPVVNDVVHAPDGSYVKRVDMLYPQWKVAIEYDGDHHRTDRAQWREDVIRRRALEALGWTVIVVVADDVIKAPEAFIRRVRGAVRRRGARS